MPDGRAVFLYTIANANGLTVKLTNYGGIITSIITPDKKGNPGDVVVGFESLAAYLKGHPHVGPLIGRYSGYVAGGRFSIDGVEYKLATNAGANHLHGGTKAFDKVLWDADEVRNADGRGVRLTYTSPDGEEGYPGNLRVTVTYIVTEESSLQITYEAETDKPTHVNLTNHLYFNLSAFQTPDVLQHQLNINAGYYAVPGEGNIPTGELRSVEGTSLDFVRPRAIGSMIGEHPEGYDHNFVIKRENDGVLMQAATVYDPVSGRLMEVQTTHTGIEFASADWLDVNGKGRKQYGKRSGFLLYPQHLPDSPNRPEFPTTLLLPGQRYSEKTIYGFSVSETGL
jgi:aldose 1-epimerase